MALVAGVLHEENQGWTVSAFTEGAFTRQGGCEYLGLSHTQRTDGR